MFNRRIIEHMHELIYFSTDSISLVTSIGLLFQYEPIQ